MSKKLKNREARIKEKIAFARNEAERDYFKAELECVHKLMDEGKEASDERRECEGMDINNALKNCPFCGRAPEVQRWQEGWYVECMNPACDVWPITRNDFDTEAEAVAVWNRRAEK